MTEIERIVKTRRSIRRFKKKSIDPKLIDKILDCARWAPSGLNNQPWRFKVLEGKDKDKISSCTKYSHIIKSADKLILVFLDKKSSYDRTKDIMAIGASIQNILLCSFHLGIGSCWLGEILNKKEEVNRILGIEERYELMAGIALGYIAFLPKRAKRLPHNKLLI